VGGGARRRLTKADLEAMLGEFEIAERHGETASIVNRDLLQIRRSAMFGEPLEEWARARGVPLAYAIALCSDIGPMLLPTSGGGMSGVPKLTALCLKADIGGVAQFH
jgi:hypothetical protein